MLLISVYAKLYSSASLIFEIFCKLKLPYVKLYYSSTDFNIVLF